ARKLGWWVAFGVMIGLIVITAAITVPWRQLVPDGSYWPVIGLPSPAYLPQYALMFAAGVLAARRQWLQRMPGSLGWVGLALAVLAVLVVTPTMSAAGPVAASMAGSVGTSIMGVGLGAALLMLFRRV